MAKGRTRAHQIRCSERDFDYAQTIGCGEATDGLNAIFAEHRIRSGQMDELKASIDEKNQEIAGIQSELDQSRASNRQHVDRNGELVRERDGAKATANDYETQLTAKQEELDNMQVSRDTYEAKANRLDRRRKVWKFIFWVQLIAWPSILAILDYYL